MARLNCTELLPGLFRFEDTCNVYVLRDGDGALAVDFGGGKWLQHLPKLGVTRLERVLLTHAHDDQVAGLAARTDWPLAIHAPVGEDKYLDPARAGDYAGPPWYEIGCPENYLPPRQRVAGVTYDLAAFTNFLWRGRKVSVIHTPGHGPNACSFVVEHEGKQVVFCGDAAHAGATVWQPFHLEWDHWTGTGALAAWEGVVRLAGLAAGLLCPAHGPVICEQPRQVLRTLARRLMRLYEAKGQISPGVPDHFPAPRRLMDGGALPYLPHLYQFGANGYLLVSETGAGLVVDPHLPDLPALEALLAELGGVRPTAMAVSHYHYDHCDAIPALRERYGAEAWLHPWIAGILQRPERAFRPWLHDYPITADHRWPEVGEWDWEEYRFRVAPWPGQTWWHCVFMAEVDGRRVLFGGDSFVPTSRWNGTGGFCAYNHSRFGDGFVPSAELALDWRPEIVAGGHGNYYAFRPSKFRKIIRWARRAEAVVRDLCSSGDLDRDYYAVHEVVRSGATARPPGREGV
jgi:glyoxylase-like metal-dependent hydrolase (beta-lactamase superfamily II)